MNKKDAQNRGRIYFIIEDDNNSDYVKIGKSSWSAESRAFSLQTGNPRKLIVKKALRCSIYDVNDFEKALHCLFEQYRITTLVKSEWFWNKKEILDFINRLTSVDIKIMIRDFGFPNDEETRSMWFLYKQNKFKRNK